MKYLSKLADRIVSWYSSEKRDLGDQRAKNVAESLYCNGLFKFSEHEKLCRHITELTDDDVIAISHKKADGKYETAFVKLSLLKKHVERKA